jgi:hypothetical protein
MQWTSIVDEDGDGYAVPDDCDDGNRLVHPEATEIPYNAIDEDCDGEDLTDFDGDGFEALVVGGEDCNDQNVEIHPGADERCGDRVDNDCDGVADENCVAAVDPMDPGGMAWTCAAAQGTPSSLLGLLLLLGAALRRGARKRPGTRPA